MSLGSSALKLGPGRPHLGLVPAGAVPPAASACKGVEDIARRAARARVSVLITGETGAGKEVLARKIHAWSPRAERPMIAINCAGLCESLVESELFGHERGAFTGARGPKAGLVESAEGGTLFLDEVGELPLPVQAKLLRVLEAREVLRVGAVAPRPLDVRFIAATNRDLETEVAHGRFRADLLFRLDGIRLKVPALRERVQEIPALAALFLAEFCQREGWPASTLSEEALAAMARHTWPGNVRELRNAVERAALMCQDGRITAADLALPVEVVDEAEVGLELSQRERILAALAACAGNQSRAAELLGISRRTLINRLDDFGVPRPIKSNRAQSA
jgi:two-component system response regulator AtoC